LAWPSPTEPNATTSSLDSGERMWRVQVKSTYSVYRSGYRTLGHGSNPKPYQTKEIDFLVAYIVPRDTWYIIPVSCVTFFPDLLLLSLRMQNRRLLRILPRSLASYGAGRKPETGTAEGELGACHTTSPPETLCRWAVPREVTPTMCRARTPGLHHPAFWSSDETCRTCPTPLASLVLRCQPLGHSAGPKRSERGRSSWPGKGTRGIPELLPACRPAARAPSPAGNAL
jgi:hypothetical protein